MIESEVPYMRKPCGNCPFRKDSNGIKTLGKKRAEKIALQNTEDGFVCHKTVDYSKEDGADFKRKQCAGALILSEKTNSFQPFRKAYENIFKDKMKLKGRDLIVDTH